MVHLLCSDTVTKYRVGNGAVREAGHSEGHIYAEFINRNDWERSGPRRNLLFSYALCDSVGYTFFVPHLRLGRCVLLPF